MKLLEHPRTQVRKEYASRGERSQKMVSLRIDYDNLGWLNQQHNKGRYINELIAADRKQKEGQ